jgi:hypothetical protein
METANMINQNSGFITSEVSIKSELKKLRITFKACQRPTSYFKLLVDPHYKFTFIYRRGQQVAGW